MPTEGTLFVIKVFLSCPSHFQYQEEYWLIRAAHIQAHKCSIKLELICVIQGYISFLHQQRLLLLPKSFLTAKKVSM